MRGLSRGLWWAGIAGVLALAGPAQADDWSERWQPFHAGRTARLAAPPMRLGHPPPPPDTAAPATADLPPGLRAPQRKAQCRRWRAMASQLGETYAGHAVRATVLKRVCGLDLREPSVEAHWDWPWNGLAAGGALPPVAERTFGAWQVRCAAAPRRRCALIHAAPAQVGADAVAVPAVVTHFVIDMVAGRESLLWRLYVPTAEATPHAATERPASGAHALRVAGLVPAARSGAVASFTVAGSARSERFPVCAPAGCLMEASVHGAGLVALSLWDGRAVPVAVTLATGEHMELRVPARGFRAGLAELMRLRREEHRSRARP